MTVRDKAVLLLVLSIFGICLILGFAGWRFPGLVREKAALDALKSQYENTVETEGKSREKLGKAKFEVTEINNQVAKKHLELLAATFSIKLESEIPRFVEQLQKTFALPGLTMTEMAYKQKILEKGFVTLPFQVRFLAPYPVFKECLYRLETLQDAVRIDRLEIQNFDDEGHQLKFGIICSARFRAGG